MTTTTPDVPPTSGRGAYLAVAVVILLVVIGGLGFFAGRRAVMGGGHEADEADAGGSSTTQPEHPKVATVRTAKVRRGSIERSIIAYGMVVARPGESTVVSAPFESLVKKVSVVPGQQVGAGDELVTVEPSIETRLTVAEARRALSAAESDLKQVQQRFDAKLATNQDLSTARQAVDAAKLKLDSVHTRGADSDSRQFSSPAAGVVVAATTQAGQLVTAGAPLAEIVPADRMEIRFGVPPEEAALITPGALVHLGPSDATTRPADADARVRLVARRVTSDTRLVEIFASLKAGNSLPLDQVVRCEIPVARREGLIVPRSAVLPTEEGSEVFVISSGHAAGKRVSLIAENHDDAQIEAEGLSAGDVVAARGNFELEDGMAVTVQDSSEPPQ
jgi:RND family efflux transporter MFP subunit